MKQIILTVSTFLFTFLTQAFSQSEPKGSWIDIYQEAIVSIGRKETTYDSVSKSEKSFFNTIGTGMIFYVNVDTFTIPCLVTAKHVFRDSTKKWFPDKINIRHFNFRDRPLDEYYGIEISLNAYKEQLWVEHDNPNVDLACIPLIEEDFAGVDLSIFPYSAFAKKDDYYEGAQLLIFGYPGIVESNFKTKALVRYGIISWVDPNNPDGNIVLIDSQIYPGNSGGPVIKIPNGMDKYGRLALGGGPVFLGIVTAKGVTKTELLDSKSRIVIDASKKPLYTWESVGIGIMEPAKRVGELLNKTKKILEKK